ncbi:MAG: IPTL-CTERM sorting domain-containing protein [Thermodesulfobacteriota bacterium]
MKVIIQNLIILIALVLYFTSFSQADVEEGRVGDYRFPNGVNIDPKTPLEIMGGSCIEQNDQCQTGFQTTHDVYVSLNLEDPNNLAIYAIDQLDPNIVQQILFPTIPNVFGMARNMLTMAGGTMIGSFINNGNPNPGGGGELTALRVRPDNNCLLEADRFKVNANFNEFDDYGESTVAPREPLGFFSNADPCIGGCNITHNRFDIYCSDDGGEFWFLNPDSVDEILCALNGGPIAAMNPIARDRFWVFYGSLTNVDVSIRVTDTQTGVTKEFDNDIQFAGLGDSCGVSTDEGEAVIYRNKRDQQVKLVTFQKDFGEPGGEDPKVHMIADDPDFDVFYGFGCSPTPDNPNGTDAAFTWIGGRVDVDFGEPFGGGPRIILSQNQPPTTNSNFGPAAMTNMCAPIFSERLESGDTVAWGQTNQSTFYSQFIYRLEAPVPTLSQWGLISLSFVLLVIGGLYLRRKSAVSDK